MDGSTVARSSASLNRPPDVPPAKAMATATLVFSRSIRTAGTGWRRSGGPPVGTSDGSFAGRMRASDCIYRAVDCGPRDRHSPKDSAEAPAFNKSSLWPAPRTPTFVTPLRCDKLRERGVPVDFRAKQFSRSCGRLRAGRMGRRPAHELGR